MEFPHSPSENLLFTTARLEALHAGNKSEILGTGTVFFFQYHITPHHGVPLLVTNRHCVEKYSLMRLFFPVKTLDNKIDPNGRIVMAYDANELTPAQRWQFHPDPNVDLAILPFNPDLQQLKQDGKPPFIKFLTNHHIPTTQQWLNLDAIEDILMVGYPNGLWDEKNIKPIIRRGITASHPAIAFNGKREFLIDAACFPGSSGSPVYILDHRWRDKQTGSFSEGERFYFLGILRAGPVHTVGGSVEIVDVPMVNDPEDKIRIPNNLGFVIRSERLKDFEPYIESLFKQ